MLNHNPDLKQYYSISELAKELNVYTSKIRYYEQMGVIPPADIEGGKKSPRKWKKKNAEIVRKVILASHSGKYTVKGLETIKNNL